MTDRIIHATLRAAIVITYTAGAAVASAAPPKSEDIVVPPILIRLEAMDLHPKCPCEIEYRNHTTRVRDYGDAIYTVSDHSVSFRWDMQYESRVPPRFAAVVPEEGTETFIQGLFQLLEGGTPQEGVLTQYETQTNPEGEIQARFLHTFHGLKSDTGVTIIIHGETRRLVRFDYSTFQRPASVDVSYTEEQVIALLQNYVKDGRKFTPPQLSIQSGAPGLARRKRTPAQLEWSTTIYLGERPDSRPCEFVTINAQSGKWRHTAFGSGC